jgi:ornithine cyclodeaminase/alanine dehydrogenase
MVGVREVDQETIGRADRIVVVNREQHQIDRSAGLTEAAENGVVHWEDLIELPDVVSGAAVGRASPDEVTLFFNSSGQGITDLAIAVELYELAREHAVGVEI